LEFNIFSYCTYFLFNIKEELVNQTKELRHKLENSYKKSEFSDNFEISRLISDNNLNEQQNAIASTYVSPSSDFTGENFIKSSGTGSLLFLFY